MLRSTRSAGGVAAVAAVAMLGGCGGHGREPAPSLPRHAVIRVTPSPSLIDRPVRLTISGLPANGTATLRASWRSYDGPIWSSSQAVAADSGGTVVLAGFGGMRFLWAMTPAAGPQRYFGASAAGPNLISLALVERGAVVARATLSRRVASASVRARTLTVRRDGLDGDFFTPSAGRRRPAVLALGGSEGGAPVDMAALLASHGYPALALHYFKAPGLPRALSRIPLEYFARGLRWLGRQPGVDAGRLVVAGASRGGEAALLIGATFPRLVHGAIGLVPNYQTWGRSWTFRGRPIPHDHPIAVERINGPVLVAGAGEDAVWSSSVYTDQIELRLADHHFRFPHERLDFPHAGHLVGTAVPYGPEVASAYFGGQPRATAAGKVKLWKHILAFMRRLR